MRREYEPYRLDAFRNLMQWAFRLGWYGGERNLITVRMNGKFEGYSGRASETWEQQFLVENCEIPDIGIKAHVAVGETLEEACSKLLAMLEEEKESEG